MIPFFVADRPMSLRILAHSFRQAPNIEVGLLTHAQVSSQFAALFASFPVGSETPIDSPPHVVVKKIGDSGIFKRRLSYPDLYQRYEQLGVHFGVMSDVLGDGDATIASARMAVKEYSKRKRSFDLVLVAQGRTVEEYVRSYAALRRLGDYRIAVGGLLRKRLASVRYLYVGSERQMFDVIDNLRQRFDPQWLFVFGAYHPNRHVDLARAGVYGSDYKGWIFQYTHRRTVVSTTVEELLACRPLPAEVCSMLQKRQRLAYEEAGARAEYARLKNGDAHARKTKRQHRAAWLRARAVLDACDSRILEVPTRCLKPAARVRFSAVVRAIKTSERELRFAGVHAYLEKEVYRHCQLTSACTCREHMKGTRSTCDSLS